jgi:integrase
MGPRTTKPQHSSIIEHHDAAPSESASKLLTPKLRKGANAKYIIEEHSILDGAGKVVRTRHTGDTYHCFFYVKDEKKWMRKSLHTKKLPEALEAGRKLMMITLTQIELGEKVFTKTYQQVVDEHLKEKKEEADAKLITQGRVTTLRCSLNWAIKFAGGGTKAITSIDGNDWKRYYVFRRNLKPEVRDVTLVNERSAISALFKYADQKRYVARRHMPIFDRSISKSRDVERRDAFTLHEYNHLCSILRYFDKHGKNAKEKNDRRYIRDFFMISGNTGLRFGELRRLKWHQVTVLSQTDGQGFPLCELKLVKEDTKNRKARVVQGMRGDFFERIKEYSNHKKPTDYVFADNESETGEQLPKKVYYKLWQELMGKAGLQSREKLTWYSLRHTYATFRLLHGKDLDIFTLSKNLGTSVKFIEDHYGHVETVQKRTELVSKK